MGSKKEVGNPSGRKIPSEEVSFFLDVSQSLHQFLNINDLILHIIGRIQETIYAEAVSVILHDEENSEFVFCWSSDQPDRTEKLHKIRFPSDQGIAGSVFRSGKPEMILDVNKDSRHFKKVDEVIKHTTNSLIAVPLKTKDRAIGVLEVVNKTKGIFNRNDLDFLVILAPIIAMALDNARMYEALEKAYQELQLIDRGKDDLIQQTRDQVDWLQREVRNQYRFNQVIGSSEAMSRVLRLCEKVINSDITVLIEGQSGTGKEVIARCIHYNGPRRAWPFVSQNCAGIPDTLLASELFGHKRGAFTGAVNYKKGIFEAANKGTIFLDEVSEMSPAMQASLLRVLQEGEIKPLGSDKAKQVDIRIISATNQNLAESVAQGLFREDLYYRLNVFPLRLPRLRDRLGDIALLARHFVEKYTQKANQPLKDLSRETLQCLAGYPFPGNVRELENEIERAIAMAGGEKIIKPVHLSEKIRTCTTRVGDELERPGTLKEMVRRLERTVIAETLERHGGNKTRAAKELGLSRYGLLKMAQRYDL